ncbi:lysophospholipid acyltransferase family protein [Fulvivirgaceae bacterium LMO-SS25]
MKFNKVYTIYAAFVFSFFFILIFPAYLLMILFRNLAKYSYAIDRLWGRIFFGLLCMPVSIEFRKPLDKKKNYIFAANHFSFLDIAVFGFSGQPYAFIGKSSITKLPLFGWMFKKLHIPVNRRSPKSRYESLLKADEMLDQGRSVVFFPEGGITSNEPPKLMPFKDGAFKLAIEKQIPIIPVTIPWNWIILQDNGKFEFKSHPVKIVFHEPVITIGKTIEDLTEIRREVFDTIKTELKRWNTNHED